LVACQHASALKGLAFSTAPNGALSAKSRCGLTLPL
jgi:hypothetical protein